MHPIPILHCYDLPLPCNILIGYPQPWHVRTEGFRAFDPRHNLPHRNLHLHTHRPCMSC